ncbi:hypothetical protein FHT97_004920 [Rhizobium sp. BK399]|nr:hypothetical protein [Rhizobium sp. BK399]
MEIAQQSFAVKPLIALGPGLILKKSPPIHATVSSAARISQPETSADS